MRWPKKVAAVTVIAAFVCVFVVGRLRGRPAMIPLSAVSASWGSDGRSRIWIDCKVVSGALAAYQGRHNCLMYLPDGRIWWGGTFQENVGKKSDSGISWVGSSIHWKDGLILEQVSMDCVLGGSPELPDCNSGRTRK